jgi:hypothetical protein
MVAWKKFVAYVESLPREQGSQFWQLAREQAEARMIAA